jgi:TonB family protein
MQGHLPRFLKTPLAPLQLPQLERPKLPIDPAIAVDLPNNPTMPDIGVHASPNVTLFSQGPGAHGGVGIGTHGGLGPGDGIGLGPGEDGNFGGDVYTPGGAVSSPIPIVTPEAEFSDEARRAKYQGVCIISVIIDTHGDPQNPRVIRALGMGLDEKALDAVRHYRFKPALKQGRPVPVRITVAVNFRLY